MALKKIICGLVFIILLLLSCDSSKPLLLKSPSNSFIKNPCGSFSIDGDYFGGRQFVITIRILKDEMLIYPNKMSVSGKNSSLLSYDVYFAEDYKDSIIGEVKTEFSYVIDSDQPLVILEADSLFRVDSLYCGVERIVAER